MPYKSSCVFMYFAVQEFIILICKSYEEFIISRIKILITSGIFAQNTSCGRTETENGRLYRLSTVSRLPCTVHSAHNVHIRLLKCVQCVGLDQLYCLEHRLGSTMSCRNTDPPTNCCHTVLNCSLANNT